MPQWLVVVFEIVKITIPALLVFFTANRLLGDHLRSSERMQRLRHQAAKRADTLPLRLQAYERLSLFCERISLPSLLLRLQKPEQTAEELKVGLYLAIQQEYEHNISQQVYMSPALWDIIRQARDNSLQAIEAVSDIIEPQLPGRELARALLHQAAPSANKALAMALTAIKKEASLLFD